jgi:phage terminase small subunit
MSLSIPQKRFAKEYVIDYNGVQAALRSGKYTYATAANYASHWLKNKEVQDAIKAEMDARAERTEITQDLVIKELAKLAFSNMNNLMVVDDNGLARLDLSTMSHSQAAAITEVTTETLADGITLKTKVKLADKRQALVDVGRHLGMFKDKLELTGKDGGPVEIDQVNMREQLLAKLTTKPAKS